MSLKTGMRLGLYEKAFPAEWSWEERLCRAAAMGYDFLEISIDESRPRLDRLDWASSERSRIRGAVANSGIPILTMCLSAHRMYPLGSHSPDVRQRGLDILRQAIDLAGDIGLRIIQVMGYDVFYEPSDTETQSHFIEGIALGTWWASQAGVMLGLENVDAPFLDSVEKAIRLVHTLGSPWFQLYPDMANLAAAGYHPADELRLAKGHLVGVHVKDALPGVIRGVPFVDGIVPFEETFETLANIGYCGLLTVEMWADKDPEAGGTEAVRAAHRLVDQLTTSAWASSHLPAAGWGLPAG